MRAEVTRRLSVVWAILAAMTLVYVWMDHSVDESGTLRASTVVTVTAILIALVKVRIIFREFMEVRHAPAWLRHVTDAWVLLMGAALLGSYFLGAALA